MMLRKRTSYYLSGLLIFTCVSVSGSISHAQPLYHQADTIAHEPGVLFDVRKAESAAAVSTVSGERLYQLPTANLSNTLYGLLPGVTVNLGTGQPGNDAASLWIRGIGSYNYGDYAVFIDGFQVPFSYFQNLLPSELESISVLKDAAALAPLGMKGANGALWVTTKKGAPGKPRIQLQARTGFQQPTHLTKPLGSYNYARLYNEALSNDLGMQWNPMYSTDDLEAFRSGVGTNTDWYGEVLKNSTPFTTADVTLNGGNETARYFVMLGYLNNQGFYRVGNDDTHANAGLQQFNARTRLDFDLYDIFEGSVGVSGRTEDRRHPNYDSEALWNNMARYPALIYPAKNDDGTWPGLNVYPDNPLASIRELGYQSNHDRTLQASLSLKEKLDFILPGLYLGQSASFNTWTRGSYSINKNYARIINGQNQTTDQNTNYQVFDDQGTNQWNWTQFQLRAGYEQQWDVHDLHIAANYLQYTYNVDASQNGAAGINTRYAFQNLGGRMRYVYGNRYVAEFGFAYSGSDNYAKGNRFGFFPTISAAWVISEEAFLYNNATIDQLKIRGSVGKSGYDNFQDGRYLYQLYYAYSGSYATGNDAPTWQGGLGPAYTPNLAIFAEQSMKYNIGVDTRLFSALDITVDAFLDKRSGIVTPDNSLLAVLGTPPPYTNIGKVTNRGIEMSARFAKAQEKWGYWLGGMAAFNHNRIDYMAEITPATPRAAQTGRPIATYFGYQADGFYDVTDFDASGDLVANRPVPSFGAVQAGDIRYRDVNGDNLIDEQDMVAIGDTFMPRITYAFSGGINFGGLDLQVLLQGAGRRSVNLLDTDLQTVAFRNNGNAHGIALGRWAYYPDQGIDTRATATYPRLSTLDNANNYRNSSFWITDGSFLRIRHIELGYRFSPTILQRVGIERLRIFANGVNLATWSNLLKNYDMDPETMSGYAAAKSVNFGFTVGF